MGKYNKNEVGSILKQKALRAFEKNAKEHSDSYLQIMDAYNNSDVAKGVFPVAGTSELKSRIKAFEDKTRSMSSAIEVLKNDLSKDFIDSFNGINSQISTINNNIANYDKFFSQFNNNGEFLDWSYGNKYKGKTVSDIDDIIKSFSPDGDASEKRWLLKNRDYFMTTEDIQNEIEALERKSAGIKEDKALSYLDYAGQALGAMFGGQNKPVEFNSSATDAENENNARLKYLKELLASKPDFDAEKAYKEADGKNLWDVITTDYTYADYLNDKDSKNIYGNAAVQHRDKENLKIIEDNSDLFSKDYSAVINIISNKKLASDLASSSVGGSLANALNDSERSDQIFSTDPEIQNIVKKWSDMGYDFKSLYDSYERKANADYATTMKGDIAEYTKEHPVLGNITSIGTNLIGGISALPSALKTGIEDLTSDDIVTLDTNAPEWALKNVTDSIRDTTSQMISEKNEGIKGEFYNFLYQTGMSMADMGASFVAGGFNSTVYPLIMSSNAAADKIKTVTENGGSVDEALLSGLMAGAFEAIFEKIGIDKLVENITSSAGKSVFKSFLNGFLSEGLEELGTDIANSVADALINGNNSEFNNKIYAYMQDGYSAKEANAMALTDLAKQYMTSFAGGGLSGGILGGVGGSINKAGYNSQLRDVGKSINESGNVQELIDFAKESGYDTDKVLKLYENSSVAQKLHEIAVAEAQEKATAEKNNNSEVDASIEGVKNKLGIGQRIADRRSNYATGKLYADVQNNISDTATANVRSAVMQKLTENGIDNANAQKYTDLILKSATERLSDSEIKVLSNNTLALNMAQELINGTAEWYDNAVMPSQNSRAHVASLAQKRTKTDETQTENENIPSEEPVIDEKTAEPTIPTITADADTVLEARESVKNIYGDAGTRTVEYLVKRIDGNEDVIRNLFDEYYVAGSLGETDINNVTQRTGITLAPEIQQEVKNQAFAAGISDYHVSSQSSRGANAVRKGSVTVSESVTTQISDEEKSFLDLFANTFGVEIYVVPEIFASGKKAEGKYSDGKLYLSEDVFKGDLWASIFSHELGHHLSETASEQWRNYKKFVIENMRSNPQRYASILAKKKIEYRQVQNNILDMEIMDEIACDCLELFLYDAKFTSEMIERDRSFVEKVRDWLKNFIAQLSEAIHSFSNKQSSRVLNSVMQQRDNYAAGLALVNSLLEQGAKTVDQAMSQNAEKAENGTKENTAEEDGVVKYSIKQTKKMDYQEQLNLVESNLLNGSNAIYIGEVSDNLLKAGLSANPFAMNQSDYRKSRRKSSKNANYSKHGIKLKFFQQMPQKINEAVMFIDNGKKITIITNSLMLDTKGQPSYIIVGVLKDQQMDSDAINQVKSVYPLDDFAAIIQKSAKNGTLVITNKNKADEMLAPIGIQPSQRSRIISLAKDIVSQNDTPVNTQSMQDGEKDVHKYSFAGGNALTADKSLLAEAMELEKNGVDSEDIRQSTGWFRGYDNKWRFEIDDSKMKISTAGLYSRNPDIRRYQELFNKIYFEDSATSEERNEFKQLFDSFEGVDIKPRLLGDLIDHDELFAAYPQLQDVFITYKDDTGTADGWYDPIMNEIVINKSQILRPDILKDTLIHEIQHIIQYIEGFTTGASPKLYEHDKSAKYATLSQRKLVEAEKKLKEQMSISGEDISAIVAQYNFETMYEGLTDSEYAQAYDRAAAQIKDEHLQDAFWDYSVARERAYQELATIEKDSPRDSYRKTAGEVEARDVSRRVNFDAEKRNNTRPDIDREDVVFSDDEGASYSFEESDMEFIEDEVVSEQEAVQQTNENEMAETIYNLIKIEKPSQKAIYEVSQKILSNTASRMSAKEFAGKLSQLLDYIEKGEADITSIQNETKELARQVISRSDYTDNSAWEQYKDVRKQILRKTFYVNRADIGAEDIKQAALLAGRRFYITTDATRRGDTVLDIDEIYEDLHNNNPEFFPETDSPMQQIENISVFLSATSKRVENPYTSGEMGMSEDFAADILAGQIYHTVVTGIIDRSNGIRTVDITNAKEVASRYYKGIEQLKRQAARYSKDYEKFAREQKDKTIAYRELARKQVADKKAEITSGAERRQLISSLKRLYKDSVNLLMGKRNDRLGTPQELKSALFDVVELVNLQNGMYPGSKYNDRILSMRTRIHNMRETLVNYKKETDAEGNEVVSEYAVDTLEALRKSTQDGKKTIDLLSNDELRNLINVLQHVKGLVTDANKMFTDNLNADYDKLGNAVINELQGKKEHLGSTNSLKTLMTTNQLMPEYFFERIGGTLENLFRNIYNTEGEQFRILQRFVADASAIAEKHKFNEWGLKETKLEYTTSRGEKINIDVFNVMSLYALYKRERSNFGTISETMHVLHGGEIEFTEDLGVWKEAMNNGAASIRNHNSKSSKIQKAQDKLAAEGKGDSPTKSYFLSEQDVKNLIGMLGDKQKAFADKMISYLSNDVAAVGNEASRKMFNHDIFLEKCYFPMSVNKTHLATNIDANTKPKQVQNSPMTKHVSTFADTAIVLRSFMDVWIEHVNQMSVYAATAPALKDFMKVYNYKTKPPVENKTGNVAIDESERQNTKAYSVKALIKEKFGVDYTEYIEELMRDLNGGYRTVNEFGPLINATKKTAVALSLSCAIQQPAAMARAFSILDVKNFANYSKKGYNEMMKYSAIAQIKSTNGYDTLSGPSLLYEIVNHNNDEKFAQTKMFLECIQNHNWKMASQFTDEFLFYLPKKMDEITWTSIWNSCKKQVRKEGKYKTEDAAFFNAVTEVFENVVRRTQVYDSTFQKSGNLRSKSQLVNMEMAFMTEPTVSWNMLLDAKQKLQAGDKKTATRIVTSVAASSICAIILKSFIGAMRKIEKDDDAEDFLSSWFDLSTQNGVSELFGFLPIIKDIYSIFDGFSIERMEFANIERFINAIKGFDDENKSLSEKISNLGGAIANIFGMPGTTAVRGIRSTINIAHNILHIADEPYTKAMLEATKNGDNLIIAQIYDEQIANGLTKATILKQYRQAMAENIPEITEAVQLLSRGDESAYYKKCREIINMGFDYSDIKAAINLLLDEKNDKQNASLLAKAQTWIKSSFGLDYVAADIEVPDEFYNSTFSEMVDSVVDGDTESFTDMYNQLIADGYSESQINSGYREAMAEILPEVAEAARHYKDGKMGSYSIALGKITNKGFKLSDAKAAVNKYLDNEEIELSDAEKFAGNRISDIGTDINTDSTVFVQEELFDGTKYDYDMMYDVLIEQGSDGKDYKEMYQYFIDNGKTSKNLTTAMENRAEKTVKKWINAVNAGDTVTYEKCLKELTVFYGSQTKAVSAVNKYRTEQEKLIKAYLNSSGSKQTEAKESLISEYGDWTTAQKAIDHYQKK